MPSLSKATDRLILRQRDGNRISGSGFLLGAVVCQEIGAGGHKELNQQVASVTALGRVGLPEDIGGVVVFLHTEEARWINGQHIEVLGDMCCNIRRKDQKLLGICGHISCSPSVFSFWRSRKLNQGQSGIE